MSFQKDVKEKVEKVEEKVKKVEEQSIAWEVVQQASKTKNQLFVILIIVLIMWFATIGAFLYYINTTGFEETTEIAEVENEDGNANACVGDSCNNGEINYGESKSD